MKFQTAMIWLFTGLAIGGGAGAYRVHQLTQEYREAFDSESRVAGAKIVELVAKVDELRDRADADNDVSENENEANIKAKTSLDAQLDACKGSDGARTLIVDMTAPHADFARVNFVNISNQGGLRDGNLLRIGRTLVLPGHVVPETSDGDLGYVYGYIAPDGRMSGWFPMSRAQ